MTAFSPVAVAFEGLRVIRREPKAVLSWVFLWVAALTLIGVIVIATTSHPAAREAANAGLLGLARRFGPLWPLLVSAFLVLWIMTTTTVFRAVLRSDEHGWHLFKLGADEVRLAVVTVAGMGLAVLFGSVPALILFVLIKPLLAVLPALGRWTVVGGTVATVCVDIWIGFRLSLVPVQTFDEKRFHLLGYWRLSQGRFWRLALSYGLVAVQFAFLFLAFGLTATLLRLFSSYVPLAVEILLDLLAAVFFVLGWTIFCACQARIYKDLTA